MSLRIYFVDVVKRTAPFWGGLSLGILSVVFFSFSIGFFFREKFVGGAPGGLISATPLSRNLRVGDVGEDVRVLQRFLNQNPLTQVAQSGPGGPLQESIYFGSLTRAAVVRFQELYASEVLSPLGLSRGTGFVGSLTRQKINTLSGAITETGSNSNLYSKNLTISSLSPVSGVDGTVITITGTGFSATNTVLAGFARLENIPSVDGKTLTFTVNSGIPEKYKPYHLPLTYTISVYTNGKQSNPKTFTLTLPEGQTYVPDSKRQTYKTRVLDFMKQKGSPLN